MSGRAKQKPPKNAHRINVRSHSEEGQQITDWLNANGFPFYIPEDPELHISRDGRTLYGEKFLVRIGKPYEPSPVPWWDYTINREGTSLVRKAFAYPIARPLGDYAPALAERLGLPA